MNDNNMKKPIIISAIVFILLLSIFIGGQIYLNKKTKDYFTQLEGGNGQPLSALGVSSDIGVSYYNPLTQTMTINDLVFDFKKRRQNDAFQSVRIERISFSLPLSYVLMGEYKMSLGQHSFSLKGGELQLTSDTLLLLSETGGRPPFLSKNSAYFEVESSLDIKSHSVEANSAFYIQNLGKFQLSSNFSMPMDHLIKIFEEAPKDEFGAPKLTTSGLKELDVQLAKSSLSNASISFSTQSLRNWLDYLSKLSIVVEDGDVHALNSRLRDDLNDFKLFPESTLDELHATISDAINTNQDIKLTLMTGKPVSQQSAGELMFIMLMQDPELVANGVDSILSPQLKIDLIKFEK